MSEQQTPHVGIQKFYVKDVSFESPQSPEIFTLGEWQPDVNVQVNTNTLPLDDDYFEVSLTLTISATQSDETVFLCEVEQAGLFNLVGFEESHLQTILATFCPTQLFPFARNVVSDLIEKGGFPQLLIQPINFEQLHQQETQGEVTH